MKIQSNMYINNPNMTSRNIEKKVNGSHALVQEDDIQISDSARKLVETARNKVSDFHTMHFSSINGEISEIPAEYKCENLFKLDLKATSISGEQSAFEGCSENQSEVFEKWLDEKLGDKLFGIIMTIGMIVGIAVAIGLFVFLPKFLIGQLISHTAIPDNSRFVRSLLEGIIKIAIFLGYMACTGLMKDIRRTYEYHGAEHKTIACYEAGEELTVEKGVGRARCHPRCGTSFIFITLIVSILVMCIVPVYQVLPRVIISILLLPVVVGISYEFIRIAGKSNNWLTRALSCPGLQIQRITTREPDASQIECAIAALKPCIPEDMEDDKW